MAADQMLDKVYDPTTVEPEMFALWEQSGSFASKPAGTPHANTFCIVIPPPNVTGALHLGHALNNTLQDIVVRYHRMRGFNTLWQPGTDHAGIATQAVVEKRIRDGEGKTRYEVGREELVRRIWQWKTEYENRILSQLKLMGCSCDWRRVRFTLDEGLSRAVRLQFFNLFRDGLIFRGKRLVNWDTQLQTAVSDDETFHETIKGHFWHIKYPVIDPRPGEPEFVVIATTRPETMLGDVAVAVHPDPERVLSERESELRRRLASASEKERADAEAQLAALEARRESHLRDLVALRNMARDGRRLRLPLTERIIPLITDEWADPMLGSGCVKITPAHDPNDYTVGTRQNLPMINVLTPDGRVAAIIEPDGSRNPHSDRYAGLSFSKEGRAKVVADLEARGLLQAVEDRDIDMCHSHRSHLPIEPLLSDQWFLKTSDLASAGAAAGRPHAPNAEAGPSLFDRLRAAGLAQAAMDTVTDERIRMFPARYAKTYLDWLGEKRDWCISRQLWWGHRIPVWRAEFAGSAFDEAKARHGTDDAQQKLVAEATARLGDACRALGSCDPSEFAVRPDDRPNWCQICTLTDAADQLMGTIAGAIPHTQGSPRAVDDRSRHAASLLAVVDQDQDVLDTWFSSALWPFSTLGWPDLADAHLKQYYPTSVLVTGRDIITNWVARMVMFGLYSMGEIPFDRVYITPKVLDGRGETMSKSKGNGVDPVDIIHTYGADALRYTIADITTETQDVRMPVEYLCPHCGKLTEQSLALKNEEQARKSRGQKLERRIQPADCHRVKCSHKECSREFATQWAAESVKKELGIARETSDRFEIGRNFCNKLWNAARFAFMNLEGTGCEPLDLASLQPEDRWILTCLSGTIRRYQGLMDTYQFAASVRELREFFWDCLCDWYIELTKPRISAGTDSVSGRAARQVLAFCVDQSLRLWHPTIPFVTERLWQQLNRVVPRRGIPPFAPLETGTPLVNAAFPPVDGYPALEDAATLAVFEHMQEVVRGVRDLRSRCNVPPRQAVDVTVVVPDAERERFAANAHIVREMANIGSLTIDPSARRPANAGAVTFRAIRVFVHNIIDDAAERKRTEEAIAGTEKQLSGKRGKLSNESFVRNAPPDILAAEQARVAELEERLHGLREHLAELS